jgi:hypothetical protein
MFRSPSRCGSNATGLGPHGHLSIRSPYLGSSRSRTWLASGSATSRYPALSISAVLAVRADRSVLPPRSGSPVATLPIITARSARRSVLAVAANGLRRSTWQHPGSAQPG